MVGSVWRVIGAWADVVSSKVSRRAIEVHPSRLLVRVQKRFRMACSLSRRELREVRVPEL